VSPVTVLKARLRTLSSTCGPPLTLFLLRQRDLPPASANSLTNSPSLVHRNNGTGLIAVMRTANFSKRATSRCEIASKSAARGEILSFLFLTLSLSLSLSLGWRDRLALFAFARVAKSRWKTEHGYITSAPIAGSRCTCDWSRLTLRFNNASCACGARMRGQGAINNRHRKQVLIDAHSPVAPIFCTVRQRARVSSSAATKAVGSPFNDQPTRKTH
jgi:hypothetical protein